MDGERCDLLVVGAGAAGLSAAAAAAVGGLRVLLVESSPLVGGTTAISGGMVWVPANHLMAEAGRPDSLDAARSYLRHTVPPDDDPAPLEAFVTRGDETIRWLIEHTALRLRPVLNYPDYYPELPGASAGGRVLEPMSFDARCLGKAFALLRPPLPEFTLIGGMMVHRSDIPHLRRAARSAASALQVGKLLLRHAGERLRAPRGTTLQLGNALAGWLLKSVLDLGVELRTNCAVLRLLREAGEGGRVLGAEVEHEGSRRTVLAGRGVVLASGGISRDAKLRGPHVPALAGSLTTTVPSGAARSGADLALEIGAQMSRGHTRQAFWVPGSTFTRRDGTQAVFPHTVTDRGKPGLIAVDGHGRRFVNEALSYHEFVSRQLRAGAGAIPAWLLCDRRFLWRYGLGVVQPFSPRLGHWLDSGYLKRADTLAALAASIGVPATALQATVAAFNAGAREGIDAQYGRGGDIYQRHLGDAEQRPNPCVAPIEQPPYFAVAVQPADLGMAAGLVTDAGARVLDAGRRAIPGLWACGNDMQSVMNGAYPGPGITLGPALVFGVVTARGAVSEGR